MGTFSQTGSAYFFILLGQNVLTVIIDFYYFHIISHDFLIFSFKSILSHFQSFCKFTSNPSFE
jgi:hypothetical protein